MRASHRLRRHLVWVVLAVVVGLAVRGTTQQAPTATRSAYVSALDAAPATASAPAADPAPWLLAFIDVETTGLVPGWHEMIDIGVAMTDLEGTVVDTLFVRIQPEHPERLSEGARRVNAFDARKWQALGAVPPRLAVQRLTDFHRRVAADRPTLMVAFNRQFDAAFLDHLFRASGGTWRALYDYFVLDLPSMAWSLGLRDLANGALAQRLDVADEPRVAEDHTGLSGALLNARIYRALRRRGGALNAGEPSGVAGSQPPPQLTTLAFRVHHMARMEAFYSEAFGFVFRDEQTGAMTSRFGAAGELTVKLVPIREAADFVGFPVHQPGFDVKDIERVIAIATRHGGALLHAPTRTGGRLTASVRDPDGNTVELYQRQ